MLEEYKELLASVADACIPDWRSVSKNDLCRAYVANKGHDLIQNGYYSAIMCKYWSLISKYYYQSSNCATPEDCYDWLIDSVSCCLNLASWEDPNSSIYRDPNGPDKVINRCMKCARLTHYQYINRKKRKDSFCLLSTDDLKDKFGSSAEEPSDDQVDNYLGEFALRDYIIDVFDKKDYFVAFFLDCLMSSNVFDLTVDSKTSNKFLEFNLRKLVKVMSCLDESYVDFFSKTYSIPRDLVEKAFMYVKSVPKANIRKKILQTIEKLSRNEFLKTFVNRED